MVKFEIDFLENYDKDSLIAELRRIQKIVGDRPVTKKDIDRYGKAVWSTYFRKFGSFTKALQEAGLKPSRIVNTTDSELLDAVIDLWTKTIENEGRRPFTSDFEKYGVPYSEDTYRRRFGSWKKALLLAYKSVDDKGKPVELKKPEAATFRVAREEMSIRKRFLVFKRDQFTCVLCGRSGVGIKLEVDHKIPLAKGGTNEFDNLQTLCFDCNRGKRADLEK